LALHLSAGRFGLHIIKFVLRKKCINNPNKILFLACTFMKYYAGPHTCEARNTIEAGVEIIMKTVTTVMHNQSAKQGPRLMAGGDVGEN
jgi:hypothetical protein